jgi:iron complex outermembrane receptor protein
MAKTRAALAATSLLLGFGVVLPAVPGHAQQPDSTAQQPDTGVSAEALKQLSIEQLMNLQVTSVSKRPERLAQTASAIEVITGEDIRRSGASSLPEALRLASNLQVAQVDSRQWAISARGFNGTVANKLLVLIDGRTVYTPLYSGVFWDVQQMALADIDRIEVISGPGATLWGSNAVNGVINVITKHAKDTEGLLVSGGGGTQPRGLGTVRYGGALGSDVHYRVYGTGFSRKAAEFPSGQDAADGWHLEQGGFRLGWDAAHGNHVSLQGDLYDGRLGQTPSLAQPNPGDVAVSGGNVLAKWTHAVSDGSNVAAQLYYDRTNRTIPNVFGENLDIYDIDLEHQARLGARHDVVWGLGYRLMNDRVANSAGLAFVPPHVTRQWFTAFVQDEIALVPDRLQVALGTKLEHNDYTGYEIEPSGRLSWQLSPSELLWTAVSRALRTPSRIDRELFIPGQPPYFFVGDPNFHSEEELAYELGYRHQHGGLAVSVATFYSRYYGLRSVERLNPPAPVPIYIGNGQDAESYGAELTVDYWLTSGWRLRAGYTELRIHIWPKPGSTDMSRGSGESQTPDRQFVLRSSLDLAPHLRLDGGFRAIGGIAAAQVPAYAELNANLTWQPTASVGLSVVGQNLFHDHHAEFQPLPQRLDIQRSVYGLVEWRY